MSSAEDDPTLEVDKLNDLWLNPGSDDETLSVGALKDLFPEKPASQAASQAEAVAEGFPTEVGQLPEASVELEGLDDFFDLQRDGPAVDPVKHVEEIDDVARWASVVDADLVTSEAQRAADEFQRFAEQFHAFATASIERPCLWQPRPLVDSDLRK